MVITFLPQFFFSKTSRVFLEDSIRVTIKYNNRSLLVYPLKGCAELWFGTGTRPSILSVKCKQSVVFIKFASYFVVILVIQKSDSYLALGSSQVKVGRSYQYRPVLEPNKNLAYMSMT